MVDPKGAAMDAAQKVAKDPNAALNELASLGQRKAEQGTSAEKTVGSRLENAAKSTGGAIAGGIAGQEVGGEVGKKAGEEAGKEAGKAAADKLMDGASAMTFGLSDVARPLAQKAGESVGGAVGKTAGGLAGNAAGGAVGSEAGSKAADMVPNSQQMKDSDGEGDGAGKEDKDDILDKGLKNAGKKAADGAKQANNIRKAADALNPANIAAKTSAAVGEAAKNVGSAAWSAIKAAPKALADAAVKGAKAVVSGVKSVVAKGASALGHVGLHGTAATVTSATLSASMLTGGVVGGAATVNHFLPKNESNLFAICLAYDQNKAKAQDTASDSSDKPSADPSEGQKDAESKLISVMRVLKYSDVQIAGTISNFRAEGSSDPTVFEYGKNWGGQVFMSSDDQGGAYKETPQKKKAGEWSAANIAGTTGQGFGYGQMTPAGPFFAWAKSEKKNAFDPGVQLAYQMSTISNNKYPWETYRKATADMKDPTAAASWFFYGWEYPGYGGQESAAPPGVQQYGPAHTKGAVDALAFVKTVKTDEEYAKGVIDAIDNDVDGGSQGNTPSDVDTSPNTVDRNRPAFCDDNGEDTKKDDDAGTAEDGSGEVPASAGNKYMKPSEVPDDLKKFVGIDPAQYGMDYGSWKGWEAAQPLWGFQNPGILTTCTQLSAGLGFKLWGITNVMGNGYEVVDNWKAKDPKGTVSSKPSKGAIFSYAPGQAGGNNHTGIVSHVFKNGDILAVETGIMGNPSPDYNIGTWSYHIYTKSTMDGLNTKYFKPSTKMAKPSGSHFFG